MQRAALLLLAIPAACGRPPAHPNILLITVDTLRADHLSLRADPPASRRETSPALDALASQGVVFLAAESPRAKTTPALASIMTGRYPHQHGVRDLTRPLPADVPVLAETLADAGYRTGAFIGNYVVRRELSGLDRGFALWNQDLPQMQGVPPDEVPQRTADALTDAALSALGLSAAGASDAPLAEGDGPWFLWLHYMDPHGLYDPPPTHRIEPPSPPEFLPAPPDEASQPLHRQWVASYNLPAEAITPEGQVDVARVRDLYDGEIHFADAEIGLLLERLAAAGRLDDTLVVVTADHGESLGEHDYWFEHGRYAYEPTTHVPLIMRLPAGHPDAGARGARGGSISLADLAPTILDLLGLPPLPAAGDAEAVTGRSCAALLAQDSARPHPVYAEKVEALEQSGAVQTKAVRWGPWRLHRRYTTRSVPGQTGAGGDELVLLREELYDLRSDPLELSDLSAAPPADAPLAELRLLLLRYVAADADFARIGRILADERAQLGRDDPEALRMLQALGYVGAAPVRDNPR